MLGLKKHILKHKGSRLFLALSSLILFTYRLQVAKGADFSVSSETIGESYRIRGRDGLFSFPRTRLIQNLSANGGHTFNPAIKGEKIPFKLTLSIALLIDHDFNVTEEEVNPNLPDYYIPLLRKTNFGLIRGNINLSIGRFNKLELSVGRLTTNDVTGMYALDGFKTRLKLHNLVSGEFSFGFETIPSFNFSALDYSPEGISWGNRENLPDDVHPEITQPQLRPMVSINATLLKFSEGSLSIGYRRTYTGTEFDKISFEKISFALSISDSFIPLSAKVLASWDFLWQRISEVIMNSNLQIAPQWRWELNFDYIYPIFDSSSIFNVFFFDPFQEVSTGITFQLEKLNLSALALARQTTPLSIDSDKKGFSDGGGEFRALWKRSPIFLSLLTRITDGESGTIAGLNASIMAEILKNILIIRLSTGMWFMQNPILANHHTLNGSQTISLSWLIYKGIKLVGMSDLFDNRISGFGVRIACILEVTI